MFDCKYRLKLKKINNCYFSHIVCQVLYRDHYLFSQQLPKINIPILQMRKQRNWELPQIWTQICWMSKAMLFSLCLIIILVNISLMPWDRITSLYIKWLFPCNELYIMQVLSEWHGKCDKVFFFHRHFILWLGILCYMPL